MSSSSTQPAPRSFRRWFWCAASLSFALLSVSASPALAASSSTQGTASCSGQNFVQPFVAFKDLNYYTLVPGGEFKGPGEGWKLSGGAQIVGSTHPNGAAGGVLNLPSGSMAISPPICVTLEYQTARVWVRNVTGAGGVAVDVAYAGTPTAIVPKIVGVVYGLQNSWTLSEPFNLQPQIAGSSEGTRELRFVLLAGGRTSDFRLFGLYVDPRMR
jgi:hypothetical protein